MKTHIVIFFGPDGREYSHGKKKIYPNSTPKGAMRSFVHHELWNADIPTTKEDIADLDRCVWRVMSTYKSAGGGVSTAYDELGTYVVTRIR